MSKRSKACDISPKVRAEVYERDNGCIVCGSLWNKTVAHFISRAQSGMGIKENLVQLCMLCHHEMDNGKNSLEIKEIVKKYLDGLYPKFTDEKRKYNKWMEE